MAWYFPLAIDGLVCGDYGEAVCEVGMVEYGMWGGGDIFHYSLTYFRDL